MNALCAAARIGVPLEGCSLYATFPPCSACAKHVAQMGIAEVVYPQGVFPPRWVAELALSEALFAECGVTLRAVGVGP